MNRPIKTRTVRQICDAGDAVAKATPRDGHYRGQVDVTTRYLTDPPVLYTCFHHHRSERRAIQCAKLWIGNHRTPDVPDYLSPGPSFPHLTGGD